ncbi:hypothetical protein [Streptomyces lydicus]|uniref:hypothetical protein n=1 Tax=Streptomyces lydicus TaxID=47763 RepID=UPI0010107234|nr:hypothetical protein [Streptomyces lydicus]MCZ1012251.1 hypothetical protein [Streptomyces lydicus]
MLSTTLFVTAFAVVATITLPLPVDPLFLAVLALLLTAAALAAAVARSAAARRSESQMRAMRQGLGLATAMPLRRPMTVALLWSIPSCAATTVWMVAAAMHAGPQHMTPEVMDAAFGNAMVLAYAGTALGFAHAMIQWVRRDREERRVRAADTALLTSGIAKEQDG